MSFSDWKKTSKLFAEWENQVIPEPGYLDTITLCESAYKAGLRDAEAETQRRAIAARGLSDEK